MICGMRFGIFDEMGFSLGLAREFVEQFAIDVIAHADGGDGDVLGERVAFELRKIFLRAGSGNAVGEQDDVLVRGLLVHDGVKAGFHGLVNFRAAVGGDLVDEFALVLERAGRAHRNHPVERFVEGNDADHIDGAQRLDAGAGRVAGHFDFRAAHASGFVQHQDDGGGLFRRRLRRGPAAFSRTASWVRWQAWRCCRRR